MSAATFLPAWRESSGSQYLRAVCVVSLPVKKGCSLQITPLFLNCPAFVSPLSGGPTLGIFLTTKRLRFICCTVLPASPREKTFGLPLVPLQNRYSPWLVEQQRCPSGAVQCFPKILRQLCVHRPKCLHVTQRNWHVVQTAQIACSTSAKRTNETQRQLHKNTEQVSPRNNMFSPTMPFASLPIFEDGSVHALASGQRTAALCVQGA